MRYLLLLKDSKSDPLLPREQIKITASCLSLEVTLILLLTSVSFISFSLVLMRKHQINLLGFRYSKLFKNISLSLSCGILASVRKVISVYLCSRTYQSLYYANIHCDSSSTVECNSVSPCLLLCFTFFVCLFTKALHGPSGPCDTLWETVLYIFQMNF